MSREACAYQALSKTASLTHMSDSEDFEDFRNLHRLSEMVRNRLDSELLQRRSTTRDPLPAFTTMASADNASIDTTSYDGDDVDNIEGAGNVGHTVQQVGEIENESNEDFDGSGGSDYHGTGGQENSDDNAEEEENEESSDDELADTEDRNFGSSFLRSLIQRNISDGLESSILDVMQRLVGGAENSPLERQRSEFDALISNLIQREDPYVILESLNELLTRLLMMNGITAERVIASGRLARAVVNVLKDPTLVDDLELHLVACRCLYNFIEVNQDFIHDALNNDVVEVLVEKLLEVSFIDLTEQCLQTLELMSKDRGSHALIISSNGLKACLQNLDFLTVHSQRKCLNIVANACGSIPIAHFSVVESQFDNLASVVEVHSDGSVLENAWLAISRIIFSFKSKPDLLEKLFLNNSILAKMLDVICNSCKSSSTEASLKYQSVISLTKSLIILASCSVKMSNLLLNMKIGLHICTFLSNFKKTDENNHRGSQTRQDTDSGTISIEAVIAAPKDILSQLLILIAILLPVSYDPWDSPFLPSDEIESEIKKQLNLERTALCETETSDKFWDFVSSVWPVLLSSFHASMDHEIRRKILLSFHRIVSFSEQSDFLKLQSFDALAGVLSTVVSNGTKTFFVDKHSMSKLEDRTQGNLQQVQLVLIASFIAWKLVTKSHSKYVPLLRKEGIFGDMRTVIQSLDNLPSDSEATEMRATSDEFRNNLVVNNFLDRELYYDGTRGRRSMAVVLSQLYSTATKLVRIQGEYKSSVNTSEALHSPELEAFYNMFLTSLGNNSVVQLEWLSVWLTLAGLLEASSNLSSFEFVSLGVIEKLSSFFSDDSSRATYQIAKATFLEVFGRDVVMFSRLIDLLQECLTRVESFEVVSSGSTTVTSTGQVAASMAKQIRIKLVADNDQIEGEPDVSHPMVLSVHAIATFKSIENFVSQRLAFANQLKIAGMTSNSSFDLDDNSASVSCNTADHKKENVVQNVSFHIDGNYIPLQTTVYGAVYHALQAKKPDSQVDAQDIWSNCHTIAFRCDANDLRAVKQHTSIFDDTETVQDWDSATGSILSLLKSLWNFNKETQLSWRMNIVPPERFMNWKMTVKLNRQLEDPLVVASGTLPNWTITLTKNFPFLFPLSTRMFFLQSTSFGYSRLIHNWQIRNSRELSDESQANTFTNGLHTGAQLGRPLRRKVRVSRTNILQSALKVLQLYGDSPGVLEIEYFDEVGSGLGPTLEFYSTVSKEFCRTRLFIWRDDSSNEGEYVIQPNGLFPAPMKGSTKELKEKCLYLFESLGKFVARALLDSRIVDLNLNIVFLEFIQNPHEYGRLFEADCFNFASKMTLLDKIDPDLARSLKHLAKYLEPGAQTIIDGMTLEDLALTFELPGYANFELVDKGAQVSVTIDNLKEYILRVLDATLNEGVRAQIVAFMDGFSSVFPITSLRIFTSLELSEIFGNSEEDWSFSAISEAVKANHGYSQNSETIERLLHVLLDFDAQERREFLQFLTGSPRLPIGGFKAVRPRFTVVKKHPEDGFSNDDYLPSVMTCANYLKLPEYSLIEIMRTKLLHAMREGACAFHLS